MSDTMTRHDVPSLVQAMVAARLHHALLAADEWRDAVRDATEAYAVQDGVAAALGWFGHRPARYWKSGGPSFDVPLTHAPLPPAGVRESPASFADWPLHAPGIEAEIALRLAVDVDAVRAAGLTEQAVDGLVDAMTVSIEVVDSRWREAGQAPALLRLADLQSHAGLALGEWVPYARPSWSSQRCEVRIGGQPPVVRTGSHSLGDPAAVLPQWLRHATRSGSTVPAGTVVTTGTWVGVLAAQRGDEVTVAFDGIGSTTLRL